MGSRGIFAIWLGAILLNLASAGAAAPPDWEKTVTTLPRGTFPNARPLIATYNFGWNDLVAATAVIQFGKIGEQLQLEATGGTVGVVRALWKLDTHHLARADATTLRPASLHQVDVFSKKTVTTDVRFKGAALERVRTDNRTKKSPAPKSFHFDGET
ncbi:MAG: DUF3108 domain-containing protein, partial [Chthoniobacterales bacterium]|nr:DUF3108 domain-containing protein [Chthoniobacterales bacterium]